jgi:hypothetical protein
VRGRRDRDGVVAVDGQRVVERCERALVGELARSLLRSIRIAPDHPPDIEPRGPQRAHVRDAAEARSYDDGAERATGSG